ncbi:tripartite motif-containing protein 2-like [Ptychodera flava]|uniref:tripartite motif-containing protein 2-like n=1 Tax=Ptychodera flava TaxID=63121 RepID=UPI00396A72A9
MATADETKFLEEIGADFLCCTICLEQFKSPKILPCLHTFCESCLVTLVEKEGTLNCPECRQQHEVPDGGVPAMKGNFFMKNLIEIFKQRLASVKGAEIKCEGCQENTASHRCMECKQYLCNSCIKVHKNLLLTRTHKVMTIEEYETAKSASPVAIEVVEYCSIHVENKIEFFCETCKVPVCTNCTIVKHRIPEHVHIDLKDAADEYLTELKAMVDKLKVKEREAEKSKTQAKQRHSKLTEQCSTEERKVRMKAEEIIKKIKSEEQRLIEELKSIYKIKLKNATADIDEMELKHGNIKSACSCIETLMRHGNAVQLFSAKNDVCYCIEQLMTIETDLKTHNDEAVFRASDELDEQGILGIFRSDVCVSKCTVENIPEQLWKGDSADLLITTRDSTGKHVIPFLDQPMKVKVIKPDASWEDVNVSDSRDGSHRLRVCGQMDGKYHIFVIIDDQPIPGCPVIIPVIKGFVHPFSSKGNAEGQYNRPSDVAINKDGDIVIVDTNNGRLQITTREGRLKKIIDFKQLRFFRPVNIAISSDNMYYILDGSRYGSQVVVSDENGCVIQCFAKLKNPKGIGISPVDGNVYVTTCEDLHIKVYTKRGDYCRSFGPRGNGPGEFDDPHGIVVGSTGMVFVADYNNKRIQVFSSNDQYLYSFDCKEEWNDLVSPMGLSIVNDKYVYVGGYRRGSPREGCLLKFQTCGKFVSCDYDVWFHLHRPNGIALTDDVPRRVILADELKNHIRVYID